MPSPDCNWSRKWGPYTPSYQWQAVVKMEKTGGSDFHTRPQIICVGRWHRQLVTVQPSKKYPVHTLALLLLFFCGEVEYLAAKRHMIPAPRPPVQQNFECTLPRITFMMHNRKWSLRILLLCFPSCLATIYKGKKGVRIIIITMTTID